ncbi:hypothetical protein JXB31_04450 [Candidatus Woesearchaeota archaeon]|nr:hypothetical protein [Candidatus Woesearchaeota archaeon]
MGKIRAMLIMAMFAAIALSSLAFVAGYSIEGGEISLVRPDSPHIDFNYIPPEYLSIEDLVFYTCIPEKDTPIKSSVLCVDDVSFTDLDVVRWGTEGNCYIASYDLEGHECENIVIESEYIKNDEIITISQPVKINRFSSILDLVLKNQYSDGGWKTAVDTAAGIWVLSNYSNIFSDEIDLATDWLKENRDNEFKCWPNEECSVEQTAKILSFLTLADINDSKRIIHDGLVFLRKWQNYYTVDESWNLSIVPFESGTTNCIISHERTHLNNENFTMAENETMSYMISAYPTGRLILICDQNIYANMTTADNDLVFVYEGDNLSFTLPYPCWPLDEKWGDCDLRTTEFAMMTEIPDENKDAGMIYLESLLMTGRIGEQYLGSENNIIETALYTYLEDPSDEEDTTIAWLRYRQNNNGSWGNGTIYDLIDPTAYSILGLMESGFSRNNEVIEDAERWISNQEYLIASNKTSEYAGWNTTEKNALAFTVLKNNARPIIKFDPMLIMVDETSKEVEVFNPTTFPLDDISYEFSTEIDDVVQIDDYKEEIPAYSYVKISISRTAAQAENIYGYLTVKNAGEEIARAPVMVVSFPEISITPQSRSLIVFGTKAKVDFNVKKTAHAFACSLEWDDDDISSKSEFSSISDTLSVDVSFSDAERVEKTYKGEFSCTSSGSEFSIPFSIDVSRYSTFPFSVDPDSIVVNMSGQHATFIVTNNLDESLELDMKLTKPDSMFKLSHTSILIDPNDQANITVFNNVPPETNLTRTNSIDITALGQQKSINFNAFIASEPKKKASPILIYVILLLAAAALGTAGYFAYSYRSVLLSYFKNESKVDLVKIKIKKIEEKEKKTAIMNMVNLMRILNKDDAQIRKKLIEEGFAEKEIDEAFEEQESETEGNEGEKEQEE